MSDPRPLNREVLSKLLPDQRSIRAFEQLVQMVSTDLPNGISVLSTLLEELSIDAGMTESKANEALASLSRIADSLELLQTSPPRPDPIIPDLVEVDRLREEVAVLSKAVSEIQLHPPSIGTVASITAGTGLNGGTITDYGTISIADTIVAGGPTGGAATAVVLTYNAQGQLTAVSTASITPAAIGALPTSYLDTDGTLAADSDVKIASQKATKTYADQLIASANALVYKGGQDCSANPNYPAADAGWLYIISVAGKIGGASGISVDVGDMAICNTDGTASGDQATVGTKWNIIEKNIVGAVVGPASATADHVATFDGATGKIIKDSGVALGSIASQNANNVALTGGSISGIDITLSEGLVPGVSIHSTNNIRGLRSNFVTALSASDVDLFTYAMGLLVIRDATAGGSAICVVDSGTVTIVAQIGATTWTTAAPGAMELQIIQSGWNLRVRAGAGKNNTSVGIWGLGF